MSLATTTAPLDLKPPQTAETMQNHVWMCQNSPQQHLGSDQ